MAATTHTHTTKTSTATAALTCAFAGVEIDQVADWAMPSLLAIRNRCALASRGVG